MALSIAEADDGRDDPFTLQRVSIRGDAVQLRNELLESENLKAQWLTCFPEQAINFELADFSFWRIAPRDARFVAGFGRIHNLSAAELAAPGASGAGASRASSCRSRARSRSTSSSKEEDWMTRLNSLR